MKHKGRVVLTVLAGLVLLLGIYYFCDSRPKQPFRDLKAEQVERVCVYYGGFLPEQLEEAEVQQLISILNETTLYARRWVLLQVGGTITYTNEPMFRLYMEDGTELEVDVQSRAKPVFFWNGTPYTTDRTGEDSVSQLYVDMIPQIRENGLDPRVIEKSTELFGQAPQVAEQ